MRVTGPIFQAALCCSGDGTRSRLTNFEISINWQMRSPVGPLFDEIAICMNCIMRPDAVINAAVFRGKKCDHKISVTTTERRMADVEVYIRSR